MTGTDRMLEGLSIVEVSAFVAAPLGGQTLASLGAEVIRVDNIGGGPDFRRWPLAPNGESLYWTGLNRGKKSVAINLQKPEGRELLVALATRPGIESGILLTNMSGLTWLDHGVLAERRADQISVRIEGNHDGTIAVDYTVNCAVGLPAMTGSGGPAAPVNHVLPAWDIAAGLQASTAILAAERRRIRTGRGGELTIALSNVALSALSQLGMISEAELGHDRPALGNFLFGAFGKDFATSDGRRFMLVAVTDRHWKAIVSAVGLEDLIAEISARTGHTLENDDERFAHREVIAERVQAWAAQKALSEVASALDAARACWGPYQTVRQLLAEDRRCSPQNDLFARVEHPGIGTLLAAGSPIRERLCGSGRVAGPAALGADTWSVLGEKLGYVGSALDDLAEREIIARKVS
jgi:2-methylfumaryl-CoA isomerase